MPGPNLSLALSTVRMKEKDSLLFISDITSSRELKNMCNESLCFMIISFFIFSVKSLIKALIFASQKGKKILRFQFHMKSLWDYISLSEKLVFDKLFKKKKPKSTVITFSQLIAFKQLLVYRVKKNTLQTLSTKELWREAIFKN